MPLVKHALEVILRNVQAAEEIAICRLVIQRRNLLEAAF